MELELEATPSGMLRFHTATFINVVLVNNFANQRKIYLIGIMALRFVLQFISFPTIKLNTHLDNPYLTTDVPPMKQAATCFIVDRK